MTDLEKFIKLYKSVGIEIAATRWCDEHDPNDEGISLFLIPGETERTKGDHDLYTSLDFDLSGRFVGQDVARDKRLL